jgi:antitoxin component YwqK of YwqJK toxin-antitoxin module
MKQNFPGFALAALLTCTLTGCDNGKGPSRIEVIKYDPKMVAAITTHYDSTYEITRPHSDLRYWKYYVVLPADTNLIARDSLNNLVAIIRKHHDKHYFEAEFYPNGQLKGKVTLSADGEVEGPVTYYYEDGRISVTGQYRQLKHIGAWKTYNKNGDLRVIDYYSADGHLIRSEGSHPVQ